MENKVFIIAQVVSYFDGILYQKLYCFNSNSIELDFASEIARCDMENTIGRIGSNEYFTVKEINPESL
jgi:hypothetical protein